MRVLVVEDDPALRLGISRMLQAEGWQVDAVTDGEYALSATATQEYDAAVLDLGFRAAVARRYCCNGAIKGRIWPSSFSRPTTG